MASTVLHPGIIGMEIARRGIGKEFPPQVMGDRENHPLKICSYFMFVHEF